MYLLLSVNLELLTVLYSRLSFFSLTIGDHVVIGDGSVVEASVIGSGVLIGKNCVIGKRCILKDNCWIKDNTVLAPDTVVAPFSVYGGCPGRLVDELPECAPEMIRSIAQSRYYQ